MIWALVREQTRAQRRFVIATGIVLTIAMIVAAYSVFMSTTANAFAHSADAVLGDDKEWHVATGSFPEDSLEQKLALIAEQDAVLAAALQDGSDVIAERDVGGVWTPVTWGSVVALGGNVDWDGILVRGAPPASGEAVLSAAIAREAGVDIGDTWTMDVDSCTVDDCVTRQIPFTVSGISPSGFDTLALAMDVPAAFIAWDDTARVVSEVEVAGSLDILTTWATFNWNVGSPALAKLGTAEAYTEYGNLNARTAVGASAALVGVLALALIAMAFAVGRAQAQVRSQWVATARALGASRRQIVATTMLEAAAVGLAAGVVGAVLGYALASLHIALLHRVVPEPAFASHVIAPVGAVAALLLLAVVLSAIVGAVPAFWAARVSPAAALKTSGDVSEAEASRRVSVWPLVVGWVVANVIAIGAAMYAGAVDSPDGPDRGLAALGILLGIVLLVTTPMLMHEALRAATPRLGGWLARSQNRPAMIAGDSLVARPRQATIPAFIVAIAVGTMVAIVVPMSAQQATEFLAVNEFAQPIMWFYTPHLPGWVVPVTIAAVVIATGVTLAISAATASLTSREAATREALGATRQDSRWAGAIAYGAIQIQGIVLGLALGCYVAAWLIPTVVPDAGNAVLAGAASAAWEPVLGILTIAGLCAAAGAAIAASFTPQPMTTTRLESMA